MSKRGALGTFVLTSIVAVGIACSTASVEPTPDASVPIEPADAGVPVRDAARDTAVEPIVADAAQEAEADAPPVLRRFSGTVELDGKPVVGARVDLMAPLLASAMTDATGAFFFLAPVGTSAIVKVVPPAATGALAMIRGVQVTDPSRIRVFYLLRASDAKALEAFGLTIDPTKGIVETDFRNAQTGGYGVTLKNASGTVSPGFGIAFDATESPVLSTVTVTGGNGSTLLYGNVPTGNVSFTPTVPGDAGRPCQPCDAPELPIQAGTVTWFDFECGSATDCR